MVIHTRHGVLMAKVWHSHHKIWVDHGMPSWKKGAMLTLVIIIK